MRKLRRLGFIGILALIVGCSSNSSTSTTSAPNDAKSPGGSESEITLETESWEDVKQWVVAQQGKVVVIDLWSTSCHACMEEFPHFVDFHNSHADTVACASMSLDYYGGEGKSPDDSRAKVLKFLTSKSATMTNFLSSTVDEKVTGSLDVVSIPAAVIFDQEGNLHKVFHNDNDDYGKEGFSYEKQIVPLVDELLTKAAG